MSRPYGKLKRGGPKAPAAVRPSEIQIDITGRYTLEQFSLEVQRAIAILQERHNVTGLECFRARLIPLDEAGAPTVLQNEIGQQVITISIPETPPPQPYRDNEPGVCVRPAAAQGHSGPRALPGAKN